MAERFLAAGLAFCLSALITPGAMHLAWLIGAVDIPRDARRMHTRPMPRTGGLAIFAAFVVAGGWIGGGQAGFDRLLMGALLLTLLGILDDVFRLPAMTKLTVQLLASAVAVSGMNGSVQISLLGRVFPAGPLSAPLSVLWLVVTINAHNMIDGLDGLSASISTIEAFILSCLLALQGSASLSGVALVVCGACLGYLPYNRHPARIFMGDTGSQLLGFAIGYLSLGFDQRGAGDLGALAPMLVLSIPLSDLFFAVIRRTLRGQSPFAADRGHWHHRLCDAGLSQRRVCFWMMLFSALLGMAGIFVSRVAWYPYAVYMILWALTGLVGLRLQLKGEKKRVEGKKPQKMQVDLK